MLAMGRWSRPRLSQMTSSVRGVVEHGGNGTNPRSPQVADVQETRRSGVGRGFRGRFHCSAPGRSRTCARGRFRRGRRERLRHGNRTRFESWGGRRRYRRGRPRGGQPTDCQQECTECRQEQDDPGRAGAAFRSSWRTSYSHKARAHPPWVSPCTAWCSGQLPSLREGGDRRSRCSVRMCSACGVARRRRRGSPRPAGAACGTSDRDCWSRSRRRNSHSSRRRFP